jgi:hypothetical protein
MYRRNATPNSRTTAGALSALAVAIGVILFAAAPAKADHIGFFFAPPFPFPVPVVVEHRYRPREVVYERPYYEPSYSYAPHRHRGRHGDDYGWRGRSGWDDRGGRDDGRRDVHYRGRY